MVEDLQKKRVRITKHAYKRHRQRVGNLSFKLLCQRSQTALQIGHFRFGAGKVKGEGLIKLCGVWWGCAVYPEDVVLTTCYGRQQVDMIAERRSR